MKRKSRLISYFLAIFLIFQMILPVNSSEKVFADSLTSISVKENQYKEQGSMEKSEEELPEGSLEDSNGEIPEQGPGDVTDEEGNPEEEGNQEETPDEPQEDSEDNTLENLEDESDDDSSNNGDVDMEEESEDLEDEEPGVLEGGILDEPITSWAFSGVEDLNRDGIINEKDLSLAAAKYDSKKGQGSYDATMDLNKDGIIDVYDLVRISAKNGTKGKIVIDPGHGGSDPGAIGPSGLKEKDIVLKVSLKVRDLLQAQGYTVIMTRTTDKYLSLQERCDIANNSEADLFISIHSNSFSDPSANGTETFSYSLYDAGGQAAKSIQNKLVSALGLRNRGHKTADFYVLRNTKMPAALTELAFISNPREEALLKTDEFQTKAAKAIVDGILGM